MVKVSHIGVAVRDIDSALRFYTEVLGLRPAGRETLPDRGLTVAFVPVGETEIEFLEPTGTAGAVAKFLETRGEGIHHVAFEVEDLESALARAKEAGYTLVDERPRPGAQGAMVAFLHPRSTNGVLIELCEHRRG
ncbi:MAG TPA: methylmalonyl-CoA epimerase [Clostridiales bacterium]|nr:methylmalonyl-CoA epimerase [Clostridiales bacterium]